MLIGDAEFFRKGTFIRIRLAVIKVHAKPAKIPADGGKDVLVARVLFFAGRAEVRVEKEKDRSVLCARFVVCSLCEWGVRGVSRGARFRGGIRRFHGR